MEKFKVFYQIAYDSCEQALNTQEFDTGLFLQKMEQEFQNLGFRDKPKNVQSVKRILILRLDAIGDFILFSPAIREIRSNYPSAFITLVVNKRVYSLAEFCPYVNEVIPFDTPFVSPIYNRNLLDVIVNVFNFAQDHLWNKYYDLSFTTPTDSTHVLMSYVSGARERVGYTDGNNDWGGIFLNRPVLRNKNIFNWALRNLYALQASGLKINRTDAEIWYGVEDFYNAQEFLKDFAPNRLKVAVGIGANIAVCKYPVEKYLEVFKRIIDRGASIVILGGPSEMEDAKFLQDNLPSEFVKNLVEQNADWRMTAATMAQTNLYIGNDTGTAHCAAALHIPVIVLGRESKDLIRQTKNCIHYSFFPWQTETIRLICEHPLEGCENGCFRAEPHCITQITPDEIVSAFDEMVNFMKYSNIQKTGYPQIFTDNQSFEDNFFQF